MTEISRIYSEIPQYLQHRTAPEHETIQEKQKLT